jgi:RND superfamily putative drug exporter
VIGATARLLIRYRGWVIAAWAGAAVLLAPRASRVHDVLVVRGATQRATEAARAAELISESFPAPIADYVAVVVHGPVAVTHRRFERVLDSLAAALGQQGAVTQVVSLRTLSDARLVSRDRRTTFVIAALSSAAASGTDEVVPDLRAAVAAALASTPGGDGFDVKVTGLRALDYDVRTVSTEDARASERRVVPLALVVLVVAFGALVAAVLPVIVGLLVLTVALALVTIAAQWTTMSVFVLNIVTMVGLGVGIDYSLFVVTRFREELNRGLSPRDAAVRTIETAGVAVVTSGLTVVIGFLALLTTPLSETRSVGVGGVLVVAVAVLLAVTLLPALLAVLGRHIDRPRWLARPLALVHAPTGWERWARWLGRRPWHAVAIGGSVIALCAWPLSHLRLGLPAANWFPPGTESGQGLTALHDMGVAGLLTPVRVVVRFPDGVSALAAPRLRALKTLSDSLRREPRVHDVRGVATVRPGLSMLELLAFYGDPAAARARAPQFFDAYLAADARTTLIDVIPADTVGYTGMMDLARRVRALAGVRGFQDAEVRVGGFAAASVDLQDDLLERMPGVVGLILASTALMLFVAFRSLLVPLKAVLLNCLSVGAAFGVTVLVFQDGWGASVLGLQGPTEAIMVVVPVLVFATVFGLSMDYEVFLLTRIKEIFDKTGRNDHATMEGLSATASVITFAAVIMVLVFGVFAFTHVLAVQFIGFGLAVAVLLDATIIRMILVPAIMHIAGRWNWWPGTQRRAVE